MTNSVKFAKFPFEHKGIHFVAKIAETNRHLPMIMMMGNTFIQMNKDAVDELLTINEGTTLEQIQDGLDEINAGGTEMFLQLGHETLAGGR